jgi:signal peptidase I
MPKNGESAKRQAREIEGSVRAPGREGRSKASGGESQAWSEEPFSREREGRKGAPPKRRQEPAEKTGLGKLADSVAGALVWIISFSLLGGSVLYAFSSNPDKSLFGYRIYDVLTTSMTPQPSGQAGGFYAGDMIIVKKAQPQDVKVGDVITFRPRAGADTYLTHRLIDVFENEEGAFFLTKGDANQSEDPPIPQDRLIGVKIYSIPKLGGAIRFVKNNLVVSAVFVTAFYLFTVTLRSYFRKTAQA